MWGGGGSKRANRAPTTSRQPQRKREGQEHESMQRDSTKRNREQEAAVSRERAAAGREGHGGARQVEKKGVMFSFI